MKKATATSHGKRRLEACDGPGKGERTTCEADEFISGKLRASFVRIIIIASEDNHRETIPGGVEAWLRRTGLTEKLPIPTGLREDVP
jgi:hypothetical protein